METVTKEEFSQFQDLVARMAEANAQAAEVTMSRFEQGEQQQKDQAALHVANSMVVSWLFRTLTTEQQSIISHAISDQLKSAPNPEVAAHIRAAVEQQLHIPLPT